MRSINYLDDQFTINFTVIKQQFEAGTEEFSHKVINIAMTLYSMVVANKSGWGLITSTSYLHYMVYAILTDRKRYNGIV